MRQLRPFLMNAVQGISIRFCLVAFGVFVAGCDANHEDPATTEVAPLKEQSREPSSSKEHAKSVDESLPSDDTSHIVLLDDSSPFGGTDDVTTKPQDILRHGNAEYRAGHMSAALSAWRNVIEKHDNTPAWNMAILNSGRALQQAEKFAAAIGILTTLLRNDNFNKTGKPFKFDEPGTDPFARIKTDPMEGYLGTYNNDWHDACMIIPECHESLGDNRLAHQFAVAARDKYTYRTMCGTAWMSVSWAIDERIRKLATHIKTEECDR